MRFGNSLFLTALWLAPGPLYAAEDQSADWRSWADANLSKTEAPVVQNREIVRAGRFEILGPYFTTSDRSDFYKNYGVSAGLRYYFTEHHGWEIRSYWNFPSVSPLVSEIQQQTNFRLDVQTSAFQIGTNYVFAPIYGKYAWNENHLIYFDLFATLGGGLRFAGTTQPFGEIGIGMSHYLFARRVSIIPEIRFRVYQEQRSQPTWVGEGVFQLGVGWLL